MSITKHLKNEAQNLLLLGGPHGIKWPMGIIKTIKEHKYITLQSIRSRGFHCHGSVIKLSSHIVQGGVPVPVGTGDQLPERPAGSPTGPSTSSGEPATETRVG